MRYVHWIAFVVLFAVVSPTFGQVGADPCEPTPTTLCLNNDRFKVEVGWFAEAGNLDTVQNFDGAGAARNTPVSEVWTGMWFFDPDNLDLLIHVFQGCNFNDRYWVFAAGLTNVEVTLTVTDTQNGEKKEFFSPLGTVFEPITDTAAFDTCPFQSAQSMPPVVIQQAAPETKQTSGPCVADPTTACLHDGRFKATVKTLGTDSPAQALADGTAGFPFSNPTFFDLFVSVIDGSSANDEYWVHYSMFPNTADFTLTVEDMVKGGSKTYTHGASDPLAVLDKAAFGGDSITPIDGTLAGSWFAQQRDGESFIFDIAEVKGIPTLVLYYFSFENNTSGRQAWLVGSAPIIGNKASVPVNIADGASFGPSFDPDTVTQTDWGNVKVTVLSCDRVLVESNSTLFPAIRYEAMRLTPAPTGVQGVCQATQAVSKASEKAGLQIDGGYSGSWFQPARDGEGFIFNIAQIGGVNTLVVFYFTYENNNSGRQAWLVGSAPIVGNGADVPMQIASGAQFGDAFDPADVAFNNWGNVKVTWQSCTLATVAITSSFGNLSFDIVPLTPPTIGTTGSCAT